MPIPHSAICFFRDGDKWCAVFCDFVDLQSSPAGFGETFDEAAYDLQDTFRKMRGNLQDVLLRSHERSMLEVSMRQVADLHEQY